MKVLTCKSGLEWNSLLQKGHLYWTCSSQNVVIQVLQKLCPHGVESGLLNTSRQMEHEKSSSDQEAIPRKQVLNQVYKTTLDSFFNLHNNGKIKVSTRCNNANVLYIVFSCSSEQKSLSNRQHEALPTGQLI